VRTIAISASCLAILCAARAQVAAPVAVWDEISAQAAAETGGGYSHAKAALAMRPVWQGYYQKFADWRAPEIQQPPAGKLRALTEKPTAPRFPLTDRVWPEKPGDAAVCLWEDDKLAAASFSIDDNNAYDVASWEEISRKYGGLPITWFLISGNINGSIDPKRIAGAGKWETWQRLLDAGYQIGSHSITHVGDPVLEDGWPGPDWEAAESQRQLDAGLTGQRTRIFAYPGSATKAFNISKNWRSSVEKFYAGARGGSGIPINPANQIDYFDIRTTANPVSLVSDDPQKDGMHLRDLFKPDSKYYRGWATVFIHNINGGPDLENNASAVTQAFAKVFAFYNEHRSDLWLGQLSDVALYGQERDTATLTTTKVTGSEITLKLESRMVPSIFDYPLTLKVRLPGDWKNVQGEQGGKSVPSRTVDHEGALYALVKAVPGRGEIRITGKP
jgi:peptidoglycan/xylan/chitin deacetylase (PgdA/CDA1 family)